MDEVRRRKTLCKWRTSTDSPAGEPPGTVKRECFTIVAKEPDLKHKPLI